MRAHENAGNMSASMRGVGIKSFVKNDDEYAVGKRRTLYQRIYVRAEPGIGRGEPNRVSTGGSAIWAVMRIVLRVRYNESESRKVPFVTSAWSAVNGTMFAGCVLEFTTSVRYAKGLWCLKYGYTSFPT